MIGIIIILSGFLAAYKVGTHVTIGRVLRLIEDVNHFNNSDLTGKNVDYRKGYLAALFTLLKKVDKL
jgi:hypothetical protein